MYQTIRYEKNGNIAIITVNRPEALNALNSTVIADLEQVIAEVAILVRIASMVFVITRLRGERPSGYTLIAAAALAVVATAIVVLKVVLTH